MVSKGHGDARGLAGRTAAYFIHSKLTPLFILGSIALGLWALLVMPREEEPQIRVPYVDVFVNMPGASPTEVEQRLTYPMERLLEEIPGVDHLYSTSSPGLSMVVVRFNVGLNVQDSLTKVYTKLYAHLDQIPPGASPPIIKLRSIYDVPVLALTLSGQGYDGYQLRRVADQLNDVIRRVPDVSGVEIIGGRPRELRVALDTARLTAYGLAPATVERAISAADEQTPAGSFSRNNQATVVYAGQFISSADELGSVVVGVAGGGPVLLREVATISDGPAEATNYVRIQDPGSAAPLPAVTLSISKIEGSNAINVVDGVLARVKPLQGQLIPNGVRMTVTRNYGETARSRSNTLLFHMLLATVSVTLLVGFALGWRESGVVAVAIPVTLLLTLFLFYLYGYTLNRITLFALIFSIGILVDDAIVVVENIARHWRLPQNCDRPLTDIAIEAVAEVGNPTILATFTVIAALLPMAFVGGLMGPYMRPIPVGASAAMLISLASAFIISPWASLRLLRGSCRPQAATVLPIADVGGVDAGGHQAPGGHHEDWTTRLYRRIMAPLLGHRRYRWMFLGGVVVLLLAACSMFYERAVIVKMLPFDNKGEFEVVVQMPDGTPLEQTEAVAQRLSDYLGAQPEVANVESYVGAAAPYNFNGLIRHYFLRTNPNQADLQVNLVPESQRASSHAIALRVRPGLDRIGEAAGARVTVAEIPPGPPVLQTLVAEIYGPDYKQQIELAKQVKQVFASTPGVVDVDWFLVDPQTQLNFKVDQRKAALSGVAVPDVNSTLGIALGGATAGLAHLAREQEQVPIQVQLNRADRSGENRLLGLEVAAAGGRLVPLSEVTDVGRTVIAQPVMHKDLRPVVYVLGDVAGGAESPAYAIFAMNRKLAKLNGPDGRPPAISMSAMPTETRNFTVRWDGEWDTTIRVFRDLGIAFAAVMALIYVLVVFWFRSYKTPLVILAPIPLTLIGIIPAHWALGAFFTATSMIGFIAGAGIIVRNSIILVDFIELRRSQGLPLAEAVVEAGAVRFRPMLLTAAAVIVGASVILPDPIFQGLAISLMAGEVASTLISRLAVPVLYYMAWQSTPQAVAPAA